MSDAKSKTAAPAPIPHTPRIGTHLANSEGVTPATVTAGAFSVGSKRVSLQCTDISVVYPVSLKLVLFQLQSTLN